MKSFCYGCCSLNQVNIYIQNSHQFTRKAIRKRLWGKSWSKRMCNSFLESMKALKSPVAI